MRFWSNELIKFVERRGYYMQSDIDALRILRDNGLDQEQAAQYVLGKLSNGRNAMDFMNLYLSLRKHQGKR